MQGWLLGINVKCDFLAKESGKLEKVGDGVLYTNLAYKFADDVVLKEEGLYLEGYITNKAEIIEKEHAITWENIYSQMIDRNDFPNNLRGSFCGFNLVNGKRQIFTDHIGSKALFYFCRKEMLIVSTRFDWIMQVLKYNTIDYSFNETAAKYMLTYGYMLDNSTFAREVKRVLPGSIISFQNGKSEIKKYYTPSINHIKEVTEEEAIGLIDTAFRTAIKREFDKDLEYGYRHLVDLSGGLDSRMVTWVAHEMGYTNQVNFSYCKEGYLDAKISSRIAKDLKHTYYFKQLDDFQWIYDIDEILRLNNGEALYSGITGGKDFLNFIHTRQYGIEHTGMIGDAIISSFARKKQEAYQKPEFGRLQYSTILSYECDNQILSMYENQEIFDICVRGFLGAMSTYAIRQNYLEVSSPFLDIDFLDLCFSIPISIRSNHNIYLKWIATYYKKAANYGWEKWAGIYPRKEFWLVRDVAFAVRKMKRMFRSLFGKSISDNMNPLDHWYNQDKEVQIYFQQYFDQNIKAGCLSTALKEDMLHLFKQGNASEKTQVLSVLGMIKLYFLGETKEWI